VAVTEDDIAKVLKLVPTCPNADTVDWLKQNDETQYLTIPQIHEALHALEQRGQVIGEELLGRVFPPRQ
jgi:hypothetical protein